MITGKSWRGWGVVTILALGSSPAWAVSFTEDFESGLTDTTAPWIYPWVYSTDVSANTTVPGDGTSAVIGEGDLSNYNYLYRPLPLGTGTFTLEYDFLIYVSDQYGYENGPDEHFAQLVYMNFGTSDDVNNFSLFSSSFGGTRSLFLLSADGTQDNYGGTVSPNNTIGGNWQHYKVTFTNYTFAYTIPVFDLNNNNGKLDSWVRIDNIQIYDQVPPLTPIPEPASALLFSTGIVGCWLTRRSRRGKVAA